MSARRWLWCLTLVVAGFSLACGDYSSPTSPVQKSTPTAPAGAVFGRYILISGVWTCVEDCEADEGGGKQGEDPYQKVDGLPSTLDSLPTAPVPVDSTL